MAFTPVDRPLSDMSIRNNIRIECEPLNAVYLDYAATTPVDPQVIRVMTRYLGLSGVFGNPASLHRFGWEAEEAVEKAREQVANLINADPFEIVWTSGATESINLAIKGVAHRYSDQGNILSLQAWSIRRFGFVCSVSSRRIRDYLYHPWPGWPDLSRKCRASIERRYRPRLFDAC